MEVTSVVGAVTLTAADGAGFLAADARLIVTCEFERFEQIAISDDEGMFRLERLPPRGCRLVTELQGFRLASADIQAGQTRLQFHLEVEPIGTGVTITGAPTKDCADIEVIGSELKMFRGSSFVRCLGRLISSTSIAGVDASRAKLSRLRS